MMRDAITLAAEPGGQRVAEQLVLAGFEMAGPRSGDIADLGRTLAATQRIDLHEQLVGAVVPTQHEFEFATGVLAVGHGAGTPIVGLLHHPARRGLGELVLASQLPRAVGGIPQVAAHHPALAGLVAGGTWFPLP